MRIGPSLKGFPRSTDVERTGLDVCMCVCCCVRDIEELCGCKEKQKKRNKMKPKMKTREKERENRKRRKWNKEMKKCETIVWIIDSLAKFVVVR